MANSFLFSLQPRFFIQQLTNQLDMYIDSDFCRLCTLDLFRRSVVQITPSSQLILNSLSRTM